MKQPKIFLSKLIKDNSDEIVSESITQYYETCPTCNMAFLKDEGHVCQYGLARLDEKKSWFKKRSIRMKT